MVYQSAFCSLHHLASRACCGRQRREGQRHHQAPIALARRRIPVLWAMLRDRRRTRLAAPKPMPPDMTRALGCLAAGVEQGEKSRAVAVVKGLKSQLGVVGVLKGRWFADRAFP